MDVLGGVGIVAKSGDPAVIIEGPQMDFLVAEPSTGRRDVNVDQDLDGHLPLADHHVEHPELTHLHVLGEVGEERRGSGPTPSGS